MSNDPALLFALAAAVLGPLVAYISATRKLSGRIGTSEAGQLWKESSSIRDDYRQRIDRLEKHVARLEELNNALVAKNAELRARVSVLEKKNGG